MARGALPMAKAVVELREAGALAGSRVGQKQYLPTALLKQHLPGGIAAMGRVPRLMDMDADGEAARLQEYIMTIRRAA